MDHTAGFQSLGWQLIQNCGPKFKELCDHAANEVDAFASGRTKTLAKWKSKDGRLKLSMDVHQKSTIFREIMTSNAIKRIVSEIFGTNPCFINHSKISYKFSDDQSWFPHQDSAYYQNKNAKGVTVGVFLDRVTQENGAICCYESSHLDGFQEHDVIFNCNEREPQIKVREIKPYKKIVMEGGIGDITLIDFNTIHFSEGNLLGGCRPIFLFDIQEIINIPLESDGKRAITFNYEYPSRYRMLYAILLTKLRNLVIYPLLKKLLFLLHKLKILPNIKIRMTS